MGTNCSAHADPIYENQCNNLGDINYIPNYCSPFGIIETCNALNSELTTSEWEAGPKGNFCFYEDSGTLTKNFGFGCCGIKCGIPGGRNASCRRIGFTADPLTCCFQDYNRSQNNNDCFTIGNNLTCDPQYRTLIGNPCVDKIVEYCSAGNSSTQDFIDKWVGSITLPQGSNPTFQPCQTALYKMLYDNQPVGTPIFGVGTLNQNAVVNGTRMMSALISGLIQNGGGLFENPEVSGVSPEINVLIWNVCNKYPGVCQAELQNYCSQQTLNSVSLNTSVQPWCGCYLPDSQYSQYTDVYRINKECTPVCNANGVIPLPSSDLTTTIQCEQSVCLIDNVALTFVNSRVGLGQGLFFNQLCPSCSTQNGISCSCIINNFTLDSVNSQFPSLQINQNCSQTSSCFKTVNGVRQEISCNSTSTYDPLLVIQAENQKNYDFAIFRRNMETIVILVLTALFVLFLLFWSQNTNSFSKQSNVSIRVPNQKY